MSSPQIPDAPIKPQDVADSWTRVAAAAAAAVVLAVDWKPVLDIAMVVILFHFAVLQYRRMALLYNRKERRSDWFDVAMAEDKTGLRDWHQGLLLQQLYRFSRDNNLCDKLSWADRYKIIKRICEGLIYPHKKSSTSVIHLDLKPRNVLLYDCCVPKISAIVAIKRLHCRHNITGGSHNITARTVRLIETLYSPSYLKFAVEASAKGGAVINIGSHVERVPKYLSVHHPLVQMVLFARNKFADTFACCESMAPKSIFDMAKRLHAFALSNWRKTVWNLARPKSGSPKVGTHSDFSTCESVVQRNELTEIESHPSDTDASGAAWVAATAASHHATGNRNLLSGFIIEHDDLFIHAVDGVPRKVLARGAVITDSVVLPDVWFVPGLTENLVSVSQLVDLDHSVGFSSGKCCIRRTDGKVVGKGRLQEGGSYVLDFLKVPLAI